MSAQFNEQVFVSAVLADRVETDAMTRSMTIFGARPPVAEVLVGASMARLTCQLYFTIYFRRARPGAHRLFVVVRTMSGTKSAEAELPPIETSRNDQIGAQVRPIDITFPLGGALLSIEVDGIARFVTPIFAQEPSPRSDESQATTRKLAD